MRHRTQNWRRRKREKIYIFCTKNPIKGWECRIIQIWGRGDWLLSADDSTCSQLLSIKRKMTRMAVFVSFLFCISHGFMISICFINVFVFVTIIQLVHRTISSFTFDQRITRILLLTPWHICPYISSICFQIIFVSHVKNQASEKEVYP